MRVQRYYFFAEYQNFLVLLHPIFLFFYHAMAEEAPWVGVDGRRSGNVRDLAATAPDIRQRAAVASPCPGLGWSLLSRQV
jgi:hypothetical protein